MSKYDGLWKWITESGQDKLILTFERMEELAVVPMNHSFLKYKKELSDYGYQTEKISMKNKTVTFEKVKTE